MNGPKLKFSQWMDKQKYRQNGETFEEKCVRISDATKDNYDHFKQFTEILLNQRFLPGGRIQTAMGAARETTAFNCFVSPVMHDSMDSIMEIATKAAETMRRGGGIGFCYSRLRPRGDIIVSLDSKSSGPVSFMEVNNSVCKTISSSGHRRGAMMAVLRIDHPDIELFVTAKHDLSQLTQFNVSVGVTDEFMMCLQQGRMFDLRFNGRVYKQINPAHLWDKIMRSTYEYAEPGVIFLDTINQRNNLHYCETIEATNPCGEQPLPPNGACLLGSFNLVKYVDAYGEFDFGRLSSDIPHVVRAMDNVISRTIYPLPEQEREAKLKRRMGLGVTGLANAGEILGYPYGTNDFIEFERKSLKFIRDMVYTSSTRLAKEKGKFPMFNDEYLDSEFVQTLPGEIQQSIASNGIRNSHLLSIAPTGTISLTADNVSSGIEPPYALEMDRTIQLFDGPEIHRVKDYAYHTYGVNGRTANEVSVEDHLRVLATASRYVDSAVSKTCNVGDHVTYDEFKDIYVNAWKLGCKGITTFRAAGKRFGILNEVKSYEESTGESCTFDPATGSKTCDQ